MTRRLTALARALVLTLSLTGCWEAEPEPDDFWGDELPPEEQETSQREPAQIADFTLSYLSGQTFDPVTCIDGVQQTVCALLSGGNLDVTMLERIITRGLAREGRTVGFSTVLPDRPRALAGLLGIVSELGANVLEVSHERSSLKADLGSTVVHLLVETRNRAHVDELFDALHREGYQLIQR